LENKVQALITALDNVRKENNQLREELNQNSNKISEMESENDQLKAELEMLKPISDSAEQSSILLLNESGLLAKLEMVQQ
jgi:phage shock protein A